MSVATSIYGTRAEARELYSWCKENNPGLLRGLYDPEIFNYLPPERKRPVSNFKKTEDIWLLENCTLPWVLARLKEQYED